MIGHELTHGVTQHEANLEYSGQSGALNESVSDVLRHPGQADGARPERDDSDWLIGADIVGPVLQPALRSMQAPGTANPYDDQPADMDGYVEGGDVHINSGIPNRAFAVTATTLGGNTWDAAGPIWYATPDRPAAALDGDVRGVRGPDAGPRAAPVRHDVEGAGRGAGRVGGREGRGALTGAHANAGITSAP